KEIIDEKQNKEKNNLEKDTPSPKVSKKKSPKRKSKVLLILLVLLFLILFSEEEDTKSIKPSYIAMPFPIAREFKDSERSEIFLKEGLIEYTKGNYLSKSKAAYKFRQAVEHDFENKKAMGYLILSYAELFEGARNKKNTGNTIFKLIRISKNRILTDINVALGTAIFYMKINKIAVAKKILENYLRVNKPSLKFTSYYLLVLLEDGKFEKAKQVFKKLKLQKKRPIEAWLAMAKYHQINQEFSQGKELLEIAWKEYKNSVPILLAYAKYVFEGEDFKKLTLILLAIEKLEAERHPIYYAKYLEYMGILMAKNKKNLEAAKYFKNALSINKSNELIFKLSALDLGGEEAIKKLILVSKIVKLMEEAKNERKKNNMDYAFHLAIKARDLSDEFLPAQLLLAEMQIEVGYFDLALKSLKKSYQNYPINPEINYLLLQTYLKSYKFNDAKQHLVTISNSNEIKSSVEYASALSKYYLATKNIKLAIRWLHEAINRNPLDDKSYFLLAKTLLQYQKYNKSKIILGKAIDLDPENVHYRAEYARILYETENVETAIGYLRESLKNHPNDPKILGDIAIYYYRSGQLKFFEKYKKQIESSNKKNFDFYKFLIKSAEIEGNSKKIIEYSKKLLKLNPEDLEIRMNLGEYYKKINDLKNATIEFEEIKKWFPSYPRINFLLAQIYIQKKDYNKALELGEKEMKLNPSLPEGYYIVGELFKIEKKYSKAIRKFQKAISIDQNFSSALISLASIRHKQNHFNEAREFYEKALKIDPENINVVRELGHVYRDIGQGALAKEYYNNYLKLTPSAKDQNEIKAILNQLE
ncbi:MAG: tetratricopeptide repeat protein, partial [Halobacteriovoraceae bacterium]|nr:tetratricopeptide repeat protein [Halobacteriovoraceae bacterium]